MKATIFGFPFLLVKIVSQKQCHICVGIAYVSIMIEALRNAWMLISNTSLFRFTYSANANSIA